MGTHCNTYQIGGKVKRKLSIASLVVLGILMVSSGWVYHFKVSGDTTTIKQDEFMNLQLSFLKQYGNQATITEAITPKIYEIAWTDNQGNKNVSMNVGGVWVLIQSVPTQPPVGGK